MIPRVGSFLCLFCAAALAPLLPGQIYRDASQPTASRVEDLLGRMTLEEKVGQLIQYSAHRDDEAEYEAMARDGTAGSFLNVAFNWIVVSESGVYQENPNGTLVDGAQRMNRLQRIAMEESRLGIPLLYAHDVIHGFRILFPVPLGMASSWNPDVLEKAARVAATEAAALGVRWVFAPMIDVTRDPRWGRIVEGAGEDPYLTGVLAAAAVRGFQTDDLGDPTATLATPKHWVAYGGAEGGRDYGTVDVSKHSLHSYYFPPFKAAFDAGAGSTMVAFNDISGIPASAHPYTMGTILRGAWGFDGLVVSDWGSIYEMQVHGFARDLPHAAELSIKAGVDIDMESRAYLHLPELVAAGRVDEALIDDAVRRVLHAKFALGLFDRPYVDPATPATVLGAPGHVQAAREVARESLVLLRNENGLLPLAKDLENIAVIGSLADDPKAQMGSWIAAGARGDSVTVLEGIRAAVDDPATVHYVRGVNPKGETPTDIAAAVEAARAAEVAILVLGETADMSGEARSRATLDLPGDQQALLEAVHATGTPVVLLLKNGRPLSTVWAAEAVPAILETWFAGSQAGPAIADVLFGDFAPVGRLPVTVPRHVGQVPLYYNHKRTGRPHISRYEDIENGPLFPFGFGLSYTEFTYGTPNVSATKITLGESVELRVVVTNSGARAGTEVVQLYLHDPVASVTRPVKELIAYQHVALAPGESREVRFTVEPDQTALFNPNLQRVVEPGRLELMVGPHSAELLTQSIEVLPAPTPSSR